MRNKEEIRLQKVVATLCATLFAIFSFLFIAKYQSPLLELFYEKVATGKLKYNAYVVGGTISLALTALALWLNRYAGFKREWTAFSYIPSVLILSFITDIDRSLYIGGFNYVKWIIVFITGIFVYALFSFILHKMLFAKIKNIAMSANRILWRNLILFVILFSLTGILSNSEENFKREALVAFYYKKGETEKALKVASLSRTASHPLTVQRAYILAKEGILGERLFEYPQYYGAKGLLPKERQNSPLIPDSVFALLGVAPQPEESSTELLERALHADDSKNRTRDYYLSALLLDRRIVEFADAIKKLYPDCDIENLPKHYKEALLLYASIENDSAYIADSVIQKQFEAFVSLESQYDDFFIRSNYLRRNFGQTYWWYYLYGSTIGVQ